ncbi:hypothetical protein [Microtetraspora malaysiensis]|uniref:hypothetical protein n=1 Tax=Microtetraspora malaysiensis TaxID=161358 RepID=UPI003D9257B5
MTEQREAGPAVYLAHDPLGLGVHAFGAAVMERQGDGRSDGLAVLAKARLWVIPGDTPSQEKLPDTLTA